MTDSLGLRRLRIVDSTTALDDIGCCVEVDCIGSVF